MGIVAITTDLPGQIGDAPRRVKIITTDNLATITTAGYLNKATLQGYTIYNTDVFDIWYGATAGANLTIVSPGTFGSFTVTFSNGVLTLVPDVTEGDVLLPVVSGDFATFNGTTGQIKDAGYLPSNAAKTVVSMVGSAVVANHIALFQDTTGTIDDTAATAINNGAIQSGLAAGGVVGNFVGYPTTTSSGFLALTPAVNATGNFNTTISNATAIAQSQVISIPDSGAATANFVLSTSGGGQSIAGGLTISTGNLAVSQGNVLAGSSGHAGTVTSFPGTAANGTLLLAAVNNASNKAMTISNASTVGQDTVVSIPDPGAATAAFDLSQSQATALTNKVFVKTITATAAALATSGHVTVMAKPTATSQFKILNIRVMYAAAGLSGGGGDRLITLTDGTIVFNQAGITAALLGTPVYTLWGGTGNPLPGAVSTVSTANSDIYLVYSGGATDYTTGQIVIEVELAQVTA